MTGSTEISRIIEQEHGIEIPPHIIAEYKYRKRHNQEIREDFFGFEKGKSEGTETAPSTLYCRYRPVCKRG